jgi:PAS domain S-box-containing protein
VIEDDCLDMLCDDVSIDELPFFFQTGLQVKDVMSKDFTVVSPDEAVYSVAKMLSGRHASFIAIESQGRILGVVTEREIVTALALWGPQLRTMSVRDISAPLGEAVSSQCPLSEASRIMREEARKWLPVTSGTEFISVLTQENLTRAATLLPELGPVREAMSTSLVFVDATASLAEAASLMTKRNLSSLVAMGTKGAVGVLTETDLLRQSVKADPSALEASVADIMSFPIVSVSPDCSLSEARAIMAKHRVRRLVIMEDNAARGIITQTDIVTALHRKLRDDERTRWRRLDASADAVFAFDLDGNVTYANRAFLALLEMDSAEEVLGRPFLPPALWHEPRDRREVIASLDSRDLQVHRARLRTRSGQVLEAAIFCSLNKNFRGEVVGKHGIVHNVGAAASSADR